MKQHYYFVSSLYDLLLDEKAPLNVANFLQFSEDLLDQQEFQELRQLYFLHDLNAVMAPVADPAQKPKTITWSADQVVEFLGRSESAPIELAALTGAENPVDAGRGKISHALAVWTHLFQNLESFFSPNLHDWLRFELDLRNVSTALAMRKIRQPYHDAIVPVGSVASQLVRSTALDFGLVQELPYLPKLIELYEEKQLHSMERDKESIVGSLQPELTALEKHLDGLRWAWLSENWETETFSTLAVFSYGLKLAMVERWNGLSVENGEKLFNKLVNQIKGSIVFSDELFIGRGKK